MKLKPLSVKKNVVGLQTDDAGHVGQNSSIHVARVVGLQTEAVVVTETRLLSKAQIAHSKEMHLDKEKIGRRSYQTW